MSTYNHLPVYKVSYDLLIDLFRFIKDFKREYKYTIGQEIKKETMEMIKNIYRANSSKFSEKRRVFIQLARENVETIRLYLRLTKDLRQITFLRFVLLNEKIESISKQFVLWQRAS